MLVLVDGAAAGRGVRLAQLLIFGAMEVLLEDGLGLVDLKLGLEVVDVGGQAAAVGAAAGIGKVEALVDDLLTRFAPVGLSTAVLLDLFGISICEAVFGKILGDVVLRASSAVGKSGVVAVVQLVRSGHVDGFRSGDFDEGRVVDGFGKMNDMSERWIRFDCYRSRLSLGVGSVEMEERRMRWVVCM